MTPTATAPQVDVLIAAPVLAPAVAAVLVLAVDALWPRRRTPALVVGSLGLLLGLGAAIVLRLRATGQGGLRTVCLPGDPALALPSPDGTTVGSCLVHVGPPEALLQGLATAAGLVVLVLLSSRDGRGDGPDPGVEVALLLATVTGATTVTVAEDLGTWLVGLELATLPVVALTVLRGRPRDSGALQLVMTSISSFGVAVVGAGLWVTATGSVRLGETAAWSAWQEDGTRPVLIMGLALLLAAVAFKLSLVPFHAWTPATYPRAGTEVTLLLASVSAIAAVGALVAVMEGASRVLAELAPVIGVLAVSSMLLGAVLALRASDPLRLVAWSAVTQGGWVVAPLAAGATEAAVGYLAVYVVAVTAVLMVVADLSPTGDRTLEDDRGLLRRRPVHAVVLGAGLLTLAGLPPGVAGLLAKFLALRPLVDTGLWWIALSAVVAAVIGFAVYLRWLALLLLPGAGPGEGERGSRAGTLLVVGAGLVLLGVTVLPALLLGAGTS